MNQISKPRYLFIDIVKVIALFCMAIIHVNTLFTEYFDMGAIAYTVDRNLVDYIGSILYLFAPGVFMICMGFVMKNSSTNTPGKIAKRGLHLLLTGIVLNFFRYSISFIVISLVNYDISSFVEAILWLFRSDILFFAGLYFLVYSLLLKLKVNDLTILIIAIALQVIGTLLPPIATNNSFINSLIGNFVYSDSQSFFPFVWWMIYPTIGYLYGKGYDNTQNKNRFMLICIVSSIALFLLTSLSINLLGSNINEYLFWGQHSLTMKTPSMLLTISFEIAYISIIYFLFEKINSDIIRNLISSISLRLNTIYCIHWILLTNTFLVVSFILIINITKTYQVILTGIILMIVSILVSFIIKPIKKEKNIHRVA